MSTIKEAIRVSVMKNHLTGIVSGTDRITVLTDALTNAFDISSVVRVVIMLDTNRPQLIRATAAIAWRDNIAVCELRLDPSIQFICCLELVYYFLPRPRICWGWRENPSLDRAGLQPLQVFTADSIMACRSLDGAAKAVWRCALLDCSDMFVKVADPTMSLKMPDIMHGDVASVALGTHFEAAVNVDRPHWDPAAA